MKRELLGVKETHTAAHNMEMIERKVGHKIPTGMIDAASLGDKALGVTELYTIAHNIEMIERTRNIYKPSKTGLFEKVFLVIFILVFIVYFGGAFILSLI